MSKKISKKDKEETISFQKITHNLKKKQLKDKIPSSITFTKLELPIYYSNLILIEDMNFENSNYFIHSNGFIKKKIVLSSLNHDPTFEISSCIFRIYPRTYNINKYKVLDYIQNKGKINEEELNFKFSAEMFNNLDIIQNKFGEPVKYGDIIMLMHENTKMFIKFVPSTKTLTLSNHDSEATLFSVETANEIMLNDNQILKSGQPLRLRIAWFQYANQNLYYGLRFNFENENKLKQDDDFENNHNYDIEKKKYLKDPEIVIEENSKMKWRFLMYDAFSSNEKLIMFGDYVQIFHCNTNCIITVGQSEESEYVKNNFNYLKSLTIKNVKKFSINEEEENNNQDSNSNFDLNSSKMNLSDDNQSISSIDFDNEDFIYKNKTYFKTDFYFEPNSNEFGQDVNATFILENIFPLAKKQSFIRFYEDNKLDKYHMIFRIKHFKTGKILTIKPIELDEYISENEFVKRGFLKGSGVNEGKIYKFDLIEDDFKMLSEDYYYSLFGFKKTIKSASYNFSRPEKNDFLRIFHVQTKSFLKIIPSNEIKDKKIQTGNLINYDLTKCFLTLTKFPEEKEIFKICAIDPYSCWKFRFLNSLYYLLKIIINHIEEYLNEKKTNPETNKKIKFKKLKMTHFILDKLLKFTMNKFINKYSSESSFNSVIHNRQTLIANFGFTKALIFKFIYNYWLFDNNLDRLTKLHKLLLKINQSEEVLNYVNVLENDEKIIYAMFKYTEQIFEFLIVYCKENKNIKNELYEYLYVYFYFFNILESALNGMIELFKNNEKILHSLIRECHQNPKFKITLKMIFTQYFPKYIKEKEEYSSIQTINDSNEQIESTDENNSNQKNILNSSLNENNNIINNENNNLDSNRQKKSIRLETQTYKEIINNENLNIIDLIFEYIKISKYEINLIYNNDIKINDARQNCFAISLISREKYFELLKSTVQIDNKINILENQRCIINKMIINQSNNDDNFLLRDFLETKNDYPSSLKELFYYVSLQNPSENIQKFIKNNEKLNVDKIINENDINNNLTLNANLKILIYYIELYNRNFNSYDNNEIQQLKNFYEKIKEFFKIQKTFFLKRFIENETWKVNFLNRPQVNLIISTLQFLKIIYQKKIINFQNEKTFLVILMRFLTRNFKHFQEKKYSSLIYEEMNKKQMKIKDIIDKTEHSKYISIAQSWLKVYLVFKNVLSKLIEDEYNQENDTNKQWKRLQKSIKTIKTANKMITQVLTKKQKFDLTSKTEEPLLNNKEENKNNDNINNNNEKEEEEKNKEKNDVKKKKENYKKKTTNVMVLFKQNLTKKKTNKGNFLEDKKLVEINGEDSELEQDNNLFKKNNYYSNGELDDKLDDDKNNEKNYLVDFDLKKKNTHLKSLMTKTTNSNAYYKLSSTLLDDDYNDLTKILTTEDEKTYNKNEISKNIINIFKLMIKNNIHILNENFYDYYNRFEFKKNENEFELNDFIENCIPNLNSGINKINSYIQTFCEEKINSKIKNEKNLINLNIDFEDKIDKNLNFIQNLVVAFNITDDLEMQEAIMSLLYSYFHQRKAFLRSVTLFNEHLISLNNIQNNPFNDKNKIKNVFKKFYQNYEKNKHEYAEEDFNAIENFFTKLLQQLLIIFRKILNYWKYEFRTLSLENANKYYNKFNENENLIAEIEKLISLDEKLEDEIMNYKIAFTQDFYLNLIDNLMQLFYFIRKNANNHIFSSLLSILNEDGAIYNKMFFALINDFIDKGKKFSSYFNIESFFFFKNSKISDKNESNFISNRFSKKKVNVLYQSNLTANNDPDKMLNIKNKYFICLFLLLSFQYVTLPKTEKILKFIYSFLQNEKDLLKYDSICSFVILLYISDIQCQNLNLNYFKILEEMKNINSMECFGTLTIKNDLENELPNSFAILYLDILNNILNFVICKGQMINDPNLDETLVEIFLFLIKKMNHSNIITQEDVNKLTANSLLIGKIDVMIKLIKIINYFEEIKNLNDIFLIKIDPDNKTNFDSELYQLYNNKTVKNEEEDDKNNINNNSSSKNFLKLHSIKSENQNENNIENNKITPIIKYFPKPHQIYTLFMEYLFNIYEDDDNNNNSLNDSSQELFYVSTTYEIYKYFLFYILEIDGDYLKCEEFLENFKTEKTGIKNFILIVLYGYCRISDKETTEEDEIDYSFIDNLEEKYLSLYTKFIFSSFFLLINKTTIKYLDSCNIVLNNIDFKEDVIGKNTNKVFADFLQNDEHESNDTLISINSKLGLNTKIMKTTGKDIYINFYIYEKLRIITKDLLNILFDENINNENMDNNSNDNNNNNNDNNSNEMNNVKNNDDDDENNNNKNIINENYYYYKKEIENEKNDKLNCFKKMLFDNLKEINHLIKNETSSFIYYLLILVDSETNMQYDQIFYTFLNKIVEFINHISVHLNNKNSKFCRFLLYTFKKILTFFEKNEESLIKYTIRKKYLREIQITIERTGIIKTCLKLVNKYKNPEIKEILPFIFGMFTKILKKGNFNSQEAFYNIMTIKSDYESVFRFMLEVIEEKINLILSNKSKIIRYKKKRISYENKILLKDVDLEIDSKILEFLQLLCENHNRKLQMFLHNQTNFRKNYDLVSKTQHYLTILFNNFEPFLFESLIKCFDLLIEFIQGPCFENQIALINSKLLITINDILKFYLNCESNILKKAFPNVNIFKKDLNNINKTITEEIKQDNFENNFNKMTSKQISLLAFKSSILLLALIESRTKEDPIYNNIKNIIKIDLLKKVSYKIYFEHLYLISQTNELNDYNLRMKDFNKAEEVQDSIDADSSSNNFYKKPTDIQEYLILETGFFLYFMILYYLDFEMNLLTKPQKIIKENNIYKYFSDFFKDSIFDSLITFLYNIIFAILKTFSTIIFSLIFVFTLGKVKIFNLLRIIFKRKIYSDEDAETFYIKYTESIEILREDKVYKIYFYLLPFCKSLNKFEKIRFLEEIDRTNSKTKLMDIIKFSNKLKYELENDYYVKEFQYYLPICGIIFKSVELWKDLSLLLTIIQNIFIIFAVHKVGKIETMCLDLYNCVQIQRWVDEKTLFNMEVEDFDNLVDILSYVQIGLACLIFVEFMCRKIPALYGITEEEVNQKNLSNFKRRLLFLQKFLMKIIFNFEIVYYCGYVIFAFLGTFYSDFYFCFLLLEVVQRLKTLRNVLMAIKNPYKELILTFILWIIVVYYFAIFGYSFFTKYFPEKNDCNTMYRCFATLFYQNNKMDNGIGGYLNTKYVETKKKNPFNERFWYDELFNLILKILIVQMVSGIIIDNFAVLREQEMEMISDMKNICTICSLKREEIVKIYNKYGKNYNDHIKSDHKIFNYIFYIIYLYKKDNTEFTGMESYVNDLVFIQKDITWFPNHQLYIAKPGELQMNESDNEEEEEEDDD